MVLRRTTIASINPQRFFKEHSYILLFLGVFLFFLFLRFANIEQKSTFTWDQVDNAWAAKNILVEGRFPLVGMVAKGNSGFYIGPAYYYLIATVYKFTNLDPAASGIMAGLTGIFTFFVLYFVSKQLFSRQVAFVSICIYTVTFFALSMDRTQWPVNFIPGISLMIFYFLHQVLLNKPKYILLLASAIGFSFHIHFTSLFYIAMVLLTLPFFPRTKKMFFYTLLAFPLFFIWVLPMMIYDFLSKGSSSRNLGVYLATYYHGFHVVRVMQLAHDAFIEFEPYVLYHFLRVIKFIFLPLFFILYLRNHLQRDRLLLCYLFLIWFLIPWLVFAVYKGEISNYYFSSSRLLVIVVLSYMTVRLLQLQNIFIRIMLIAYWAFFMIVNLLQFQALTGLGLATYREEVRSAIVKGQVIPFTEGSPQSYLYYINTRK